MPDQIQFIDEMLEDEIADPTKTLDLVCRAKGMEKVVPNRVCIPAADRPSYERQDYESDFQWWAFQQYLAQGITRTISETAKRVKENNPAVSQKEATVRSILSRASAKLGWVQRAKDFDVQVELARAVKAMDDIYEMNDRQAETAVELQAMCLHELEKWQRQSEESFEPVITLTQLTKTMEMAFRAERLARGEPSAIIVNKTNQDNSQAQERFRALMSNPDSVDAFEALAELVPDDTDVN